MSKENASQTASHASFTVVRSVVNDVNTLEELGAWEKHHVNRDANFFTCYVRECLLTMLATHFG